MSGSNGPDLCRVNNPVVANGLRYAFLGGQANWLLSAESMAVSAALFVAGTFLFRRMERRFADII